MRLLVIECSSGLQGQVTAGPPREQRGPALGESFHVHIGIGSACLHAYLSTLTMKVLLIILPKCSLIESRQCNGKKKEQREDTVQKGEKKKKPHGAPFLE